MFKNLDKATKTLLERTSLKLKFDDLLTYINLQYPQLGMIYKYQPITEGYEDANFLIYTSKGKFVLKIFYKGRSNWNIQSYVKIIKQANAVGVQTMELIRGKNSFIGRMGDTCYIICKFFSGKDFKCRTPSLKIIGQMTKEIAKLNTLNFRVKESYDSWSNANLLKEYQLHKQKLDSATIEYLKPTIIDLEKLDLRNFSHSIIHGDLQRLHVLENKSGKLCLIDYGCARNDLKVYEVSTFLAWFCLSADNWKNKIQIWKTAMQIYTKMHKLSKEEIDSLNILTEAAFAAYYLKTLLLMKSGDRSGQTCSWHKQAKIMLDLIRE